MNDTGARLIEAATEAFASRGFHGTTTRDIAERAGVTPGAVYVHHKSKEDLLYAISARGHDNVLRLVRDCVADGSQPTTEKMRHLVREFARWQASHHTSARIVNYELRFLGPEHFASAQENRRQIQAIFRNLVAQGCEEGTFSSDDVDFTVVAIFSLCIDIGRWYSQKSHWSVDEGADNICSLVMKMLQP
jgi:AcrR family transcriptional regulator